MVTPLKYDDTEIRRYRRYRLYVLALILLVTSAWLVHAWIAVSAAREIRIHNALDRNLAIAQLSARLLDEQWDGAVSVLRVLGKRNSLVASLRAKDRRAVRQNLSEAVDLVPDLVFAAAYQPGGGLVTSYPSSPVPPVNAVGTDWFRAVSTAGGTYEGEVIRLPDARRTEAIALAVPLKAGTRPTGYLLAYYRLGEIDEWLNQLRVTDGTILYIVDATGHVVTASGRPENRRVHFSDYPALLLALNYRAGVLTAAKPQHRGQALIGYALADKPGWAVLVIQPREAALVATNYLVQRFSSLAIPTLALMLVAGLTLVILYRRQESMAHQLTEQNERLRAADRAKSDFLANVSHNLRTPLASMQVSISGLLETDIEWDREQVRECLHLASEELDQLTGRVRNLLEMSRLEADAFAVRKEPSDLTDIVGSALERLEPLTRGRAIKADFPSEPLLVECDQAQIETVIANLVENAVKYSPPGTPLHLRGTLRDGYALFTIRDEGPGVNPGDEERVFEKFYRAPTNRSAGGIGLGLAICKAVVEAHNGAIGVQNAPGGGAEFWFSLPVLPSLEEVTK